jgi:hypothetical protein
MLEREGNRNRKKEYTHIHTCILITKKEFIPQISFRKKKKNAHGKTHILLECLRRNTNVMRETEREDLKRTGKKYKESK